MAIDFIHPQNYAIIFYYSLFIVVLLTNIHTATFGFNSKMTLNFNKFFGYFVLLILLTYVGLRPLDGVFADMTIYANQFKRHQLGIFNYDDLKDPVFHGFVYLCSQVMSVNLFFLLCAIIYIVPLYLACKNFFGSHWFYAFLFVISTLTFWNYGVNGIRNGLATSLFIFALSSRNNKIRILFFILSIAFHKSMLLPFLGFFLYRFGKIRLSYFFILWIISIPLSLLAGGFWEDIFAFLGFDDERLSYLTTEADENKFSNTGFRWDFLLFSLLPILVSYFVLYVKKIKDTSYESLVAVYLFANAFWILVIRASFSNRFAFLSWFIMAFIIAYPFLKYKLINKQHLRFGIITLSYFLITFFLNVILKK